MNEPDDSPAMPWLEANMWFWQRAAPEALRTAFERVQRQNFEELEMLSPGEIQTVAGKVYRAKQGGGALSALPDLERDMETYTYYLEVSFANPLVSPEDIAEAPGL
ncbi:hypothetical protein RI367_007301 [Sorochytrium milnesiophthora]